MSPTAQCSRLESAATALRLCLDRHQLQAEKEAEGFFSWCLPLVSSTAGSVGVSPNLSRYSTSHFNVVQIPPVTVRQTVTFALSAPRVLIQLASIHVLWAAGRNPLKANVKRPIVGPSLSLGGHLGKPAQPFQSHSLPDLDAVDHARRKRQCRYRFRQAKKAPIRDASVS